MENADGFAEVFPEHKYEIVKMLQVRRQGCAQSSVVCCAHTVLLHMLEERHVKERGVQFKYSTDLHCSAQWCY